MGITNMLVSLWIITIINLAGAAVYYGESVGSLSTLHHAVAGDVYIVDRNRIRIVGFTYDGTAPDAFLWAGVRGRNGASPGPDGVKLNDETGGANPLGAYSSADVVVTLPNGITSDQLTWLSIWCRDFEANFGHVMFPSGLAVPASRDVGQFSKLAHQVSSGEVTVMDAKTLFIRNLRYDGQGPDAFLLVGTGNSPHAAGTKVPDENGSLAKLKAYNGQDITVRLPGDLTVYDIDWISIYCITYTHDFGNIILPNDIRVPPYIERPAEEGPLANCKQLHKYMNVGWEVMGDNLVVELTGALEDNGYMAFGLSGSESRSSMIGADVMVVYYDESTQGFVAEDYTLSQYAMCGSTGEGVCPDIKRSGGQNNLRLFSASVSHGVSTFRLTRPLVKGDEHDLAVKTAGESYVVWAMGRLTTDRSYQVTKHNLRLTGDLSLNFGSNTTPVAGNECTSVTRRDEVKVEPWDIPYLSGVDTKTFNITIGPSGGDRGYSAITGKQPWGIAYYVNGWLIPEIYLLRNQTYTFVIESGDNLENTAEYHPFYITDDSQGGYSKKTTAEKQSVEVYLGVDANGDPTPNAAGQFCEYQHPITEQAELPDTFEEYRDSLKLVCKGGEGGVMTWTPDENTPDMLYYQCWAHNYLGWKIHVMDSPKDIPPPTGLASRLIYSCVVMMMCIAIATFSWI